MTVYLDDPTHGWDDWIKRGPKGPQPSPPWLTASGDFDETKHPRDERGRWTDSAALPHDEAGGFRQLGAAEKMTWARDRALAQGRTPERAERIAQVLYGEADRVNAGYEVHVRPDGTFVEFAGKARVSAAAKDEVLKTVGELQGLYPDQGPRSVSLAQQAVAKALSPGAAGMTVRGGDHIVLAPSSVKPAGERGFQLAVAAGKYEPSGADTSFTRYALYHEWGHTADTPRGRDRPAETERALQTIAAGSGYGRASQPYALQEFHDPTGVKKKDGSEAFAESFAEWHLTRGQTQDPLARALANSEGWRKFRGG